MATQWTKDELKQIRATYLGTHRRLKDEGVPREKRNEIAKEVTRATREHLLNKRNDRSRGHGQTQQN